MSTRFNVMARMVGGVGAMLVIAACGGQSPAPAESAAPAAAPAQAAAPAADQIERGRMLVVGGACHDCHSPKKFVNGVPEVDQDRQLSGHPEGDKVTAQYVPAKGSPWLIATTGDLTSWSGPWGISFPINLTPDPVTGLRSGVWTEELFIKALRTGKHMGTARDILPPMPWQMYAQLSDDDLKAIWAYLGTIKPIVNHVPDPIPPPGAPTQ